MGFIYGHVVRVTLTGYNVTYDDDDDDCLRATTLGELTIANLPRYKDLLWYKLVPW